MKKMNYVRPLAEVIELDELDIITASKDPFAHEDGGEIAGNENKASGDYVPVTIDEQTGKIILPGTTD